MIFTVIDTLPLGHLQMALDLLFEIFFPMSASANEAHASLDKVECHPCVKVVHQHLFPQDHRTYIQRFTAAAVSLGTVLKHSLA